TSGPQLAIEERAFIAEQKAFGHNRVPMVIAARTGRNARVAALIRSLGGEVAGRADAIDYLYVIVPIGQLERVRADADVEESALAINTINPYFDGPQG